MHISKIKRKLLKFHMNKKLISENAPKKHLKKSHPSHYTKQTAAPVQVGLLPGKKKKKKRHFLQNLKKCIKWSCHPVFFN